MQQNKLPVSDSGLDSGLESRLDSSLDSTRESGLDSGLDSARDSGDLKAAINLPPFIRFAIEILESSGFEAFVVGGCVRDSLLGITPKDWDITTDATPEKIALVFSKYECKALNIGEKFGTIGVLIKEENTHFVEWQEKWRANMEGENLDSAYRPRLCDKQPQNRQQKHHQKMHCQKIHCVEITTYRHDTAYKDHRHPESVRFCQSLVEDLSRRDFTCNALAYSPHLDSVDSGAFLDSGAQNLTSENLAYKKPLSKNIAAKYRAKYGDIARGGICDAFGGVDDMRAQILRCVGDARQRFDEDALRILRALRFSATLGFAIEPRTRDALLQRAPKLAHISLERKSNEWLKTLRTPHARGVISEYLRVWAVVFVPFESEILLLARGRESMHEAESKSDMDSMDKIDSSLESARAIYARFCRHLALLDDMDSALEMLKAGEARKHKMHKILEAHKLPNTPESAKSSQSKAKRQAANKPESSGLDSDALDSILRLCVWFFALSEATRAINTPKLDSNPDSALRAKSTAHANALPAEPTSQAESTPRADMAQIAQSLELLRLSKAMTQTCIFLLTHAHIPLANSAVGLKIWARDFGIMRARILLAFLWLTRPSERGDIARAKELLESISTQCYSLDTLAINGNDIKRLALEIGANISGKEVGTILEKLLESIINDDLPNTKEALQNKARFYIDNIKVD